jgi:hypothetical protein
MKMEYRWCMPNHLTFKMKPVSAFIGEKKGLTIDPFANRKHGLANITNDLNESCDTHFNLDALSFLKTFESQTVDRLLFDPPYSLRQLKECYDGIGKNITSHESRHFFSDLKNEIERVMKKGGEVFSFGWSSVGMGKKRGFIKNEILILCHGGIHNDTICLKEVKQ